MKGTNPERLIRLLRKNVLKIIFKKLDGSIREATGTMKKNLVPKPKTKGTSVADGQMKMAKKMHALPKHLVFYFDLEKKNFRSFLKSRLIEFSVVEKQKKEDSH